MKKKEILTVLKTMSIGNYSRSEKEALAEAIKAVKTAKRWKKRYWLLSKGVERAFHDGYMEGYDAGSKSEGGEP